MHTWKFPLSAGYCTRDLPARPANLKLYTSPCQFCKTPFVCLTNRVACQAKQPRLWLFCTMQKAWQRLGVSKPVQRIYSHVKIWNENTCCVQAPVLQILKCVSCGMQILKNTILVHTTQLSNHKSGSCYKRLADNSASCRFVTPLYGTPALVNNRNVISTQGTHDMS